MGLRPPGLQNEFKANLDYRMRCYFQTKQAARENPVCENAAQICSLRSSAALCWRIRLIWSCLERNKIPSERLFLLQDSEPLPGWHSEEFSGLLMVQGGFQSIIFRVQINWIRDILVTSLVGMTKCLIEAMGGREEGKEGEREERRERRKEG